MNRMGWCSTPPCPQNVPMDDILQINKFICAAALTMSRGVGVDKMEVLAASAIRPGGGGVRMCHSSGMCAPSLGISYLHLVVRVGHFNCHDLSSAEELYCLLRLKQLQQYADGRLANLCLHYAENTMNYSPQIWSELGMRDIRY